MVAKHILERPAQFQWDTDSLPCQNSNCRCTCEAMIAGFYKDTHISPEQMRHAMGYSVCGGTDAPHGVTGLTHYGIKASWGQLTTSELILKLNKNIPVDIAVLYGKIPRNSAYIQDMSFYGLHSVLACKRTRNAAGTLGLLIRDPDRWGSGKVSYVFWPDSVWVPAWAAAKYVAVWPNNPKYIPPTPPPVTATYKISISPNALIYLATLGKNGCIAKWDTYKWGPNASNAPCLAPVKRVGCSSGSATVVYVTAGVFKGRFVKLGAGVTLVKS